MELLGRWPPTSLPPAYLRYSPVYLERILIYGLCYVTIKTHRTVIIIKHGINSNLNVCSLLKVTYGSRINYLLSPFETGVVGFSLHPHKAAFKKPRF